MNIPADLSFPILKWDVRGSKLHDVQIRQPVPCGRMEPDSLWRPLIQELFDLLTNLAMQVEHIVLVDSLPRSL